MRKTEQSWHFNDISVPDTETSFQIKILTMSLWENQTKITGFSFKKIKKDDLINFVNFAATGTFHKSDFKLNFSANPIL